MTTPKDPSGRVWPRRLAQPRYVLAVCRSVGGLGLALMVSASGGCRTQPAPSVVTASPGDVAPTDDEAGSETTSPEVPDALDGPGIAVTISPRIEPEPRVQVEISIDGPAESLEVLRMPGPIAGNPLRVVVRDVKGSLPYALEPEDAGGLTLRVTKAVTPPLSLRYELAPAPARIGQTSRLELSPGSMFATGEALLLLPAATRLDRQALQVRIDPAGLAVETEAEDDAGPLVPLRALSTFSEDAEARLQGLPYELHRAGYAAGYLEHARFDARGGLDRFAATGSPSYDTRWIAAEIAGLRTETDLYFRQQTEGVHVTLLAAGPRIPATPPHVTELRGRGLVISADAAASWDAPARLGVATTLVQRWIGGRVRMLASKEAAPDSAWALWFHGGVARFVARELLFGLSLLSSEEYRDEADAIELELATSPLRERTLDELAALVRDPNPRVSLDARAQLIARGAIYATWIDARMRVQEHPDDISELLGTIITVAVMEGHTTLTLDQWLDHVRGFVWSEAREEFESVVGRGKRPKLASDALGPCFRPRSARLRRFDLGLVDVSVPGKAGIAMIEPEGPAAKAGLRADDAVVQLSYVDGDPTTRVKAVVTRDGVQRTVSYMPAGSAQPGFRWQRQRGVSDERCVR